MQRPKVCEVSPECTRNSLWWKGFVKQVNFEFHKIFGRGEAWPHYILVAIQMMIRIWVFWIRIKFQMQEFLKGSFIYHCSFCR